MTRAPKTEHRDIPEDFVIITPSYPRDLERCALLVESLDRCCPDAKHYLIVDRWDMAPFRKLASSRTELIESEAVIEPWLRRFPSSHGFWVSMKTLPVRGWMMQQIRKIGIAKAVTCKNLVYCDSDMAFIRPFGLRDLLEGGKLGLLDVAYQDDQVRRWTADARRLLGLTGDAAGTRGHVGQMICWRRDNVIAMQQRIEATCGMSWQQALARLRTVSEYILYGVFVRQVIGYGGSGHKPSQVPLVKTSWDTDMTTPQGIDDFFKEFDSRTIAIMAHSKDSIDQVRLRELIEAQWRRAGET